MTGWASDAGRGPTPGESGVEVTRVHAAGVATRGGVVARAAVAAHGMPGRAMRPGVVARRPGPPREMARAAMRRGMVSPVPGRGVVARLMMPGRHPVQGVTVMR